MSSIAATQGATSAKTVVALASAALLFSSAFPAIRFAVATLPPVTVALMRCVIASTAFMFVVPPAFLIRLPWRDLVRGFIAGGLGIGVYNVALMIGEETVPAGEASFLVCSGPVFTALLGVLFLHEKVTRVGWLGILVSLTGVAIMVLPGQADFSFGRGLLLVCVAMVAQSLQFITQKRLLSKYSATSVTAMQMWSGALLLLPFAPSVYPTLGHVTLKALGAILFLAIGTSVLGYTAWSYVSARFPVSRAATFLYLNPPISVVIAILWLHEIPSTYALLGGFTAIAGVFLYNTLGKSASR